MAKIHWGRILDNPIATQLLWAELGHEDPTLLDEACSISGPFDDFEDAFGCIMDKNTFDVSLLDYDAASTLPLDQTLAICARHVAEGKIIIINDRKYTLKEGKLVELPSK